MKALIGLLPLIVSGIASASVGENVRYFNEVVSMKKMPNILKQCEVTNRETKMARLWIKSARGSQPESIELISHTLDPNHPGQLNMLGPVFTFGVDLKETMGSQTLYQAGGMRTLTEPSNAIRSLMCAYLTAQGAFPGATSESCSSDDGLTRDQYCGFLKSSSGTSEVPDGYIMGCTRALTSMSLSIDSSGNGRAEVSVLPLEGTLEGASTITLHLQCK